MADRIVEGLWDCPYCGTKAIGGLTKHCPCCGHPQDQGTRFYMGDKINYLDEELAAQYGKGADWVCAYCGSLNRARFTYCANCGSEKSESKADYFGKNPNPQAEKKQPPKAKPDRPKAKKPLWRRLLPLFIIAAVVIALISAFMPRNMQAEVTAMDWERRIEIEAYRTVRESDWSVPAGGRVVSQRQEIHHYDQVLDHYETRTRTVSEEVYDGTDTYTSYSDNGDGTFTESSYDVPRYRTEYRTETYSEPIYRDEPVYQTKYSYDIDKWVVDREEEASGTDNAPYWPEYTLASNEQTGAESEYYFMTVQAKDDQYVAMMTYDQWQNYHTGDQVEITVTAGDITEVNGESVE